MTMLLRGGISLLLLLGLALAMNINNSVAIGALTLRARTRAEGLRMRVYGLLISLGARVVLVLVLAASLRPEFEALLGLRLGLGVHKALALGAGACLMVMAFLEIRRRAYSSSAPEAGRSRVGAPLAWGHGILLVAVSDIALSFDSLIAVAGLATHPVIMPAIVVVEVTVILCMAETVARTLRRHPALETLALCALILMGAVMILRAFGWYVTDSTVYAMVGFALMVQLIDYLPRRPAALRCSHTPRTRPS